MPQFLVELYASRSEPDATRRGNAVRARLAAQTLSRNGINVRYLGSLFVPEEETAFHLYEAAAAADVCEAARRAGMPVHRVVEAINTDATGSDPTEDHQHHEEGRRS
jgi:Nickel responsive protein SCO4226-like